MKTLKNYKILTIFCKCGEKLCRYKKGPGRRLLKIHRDRITKDYTGILKHYKEKETDILCPNCKQRFATVKCINGKYVNKINQGQLGIVK